MTLNTAYEKKSVNVTLDDCTPIWFYPQNRWKTEDSMENFPKILLFSKSEHDDDSET